MNSAKPKTIKKLLATKLDEWTDTLPEDLQQAVRKDAMIMGGAINALLMGYPINDFDVYFKTHQTAKAIAEYYVDKMQADNSTNFQAEVSTDHEFVNIKGETETRVVIKIESRGVLAEETEAAVELQEYGATELALAEKDDETTSTEKEPYRPVFISSNAVTLSNRMQLITRFTGTKEEVLKNFDFAHAMVAYDWAENKLYLPERALVAMMNKSLQYDGSLYPIASIFRMKKFIERGWRITAGEQLKIMWQISELDMTSIPLLMDQLTGVDAAYMGALIDALSEAEDAAETLTSTYVAEIIDRIFN